MYIPRRCIRGLSRYLLGSPHPSLYQEDLPHSQPNCRHNKWYCLILPLVVNNPVPPKTIALRCFGVFCRTHNPATQVSVQGYFAGSQTTIKKSGRAKKRGSTTGPRLVTTNSLVACNQTKSQDYVCYTPSDLRVT